MKFINGKLLKPIINGKIGEKGTRMLIDSGADYVFLNVPKYKIRLDENNKPIKDNYGRYLKDRLYIDAVYDQIIRENYGSFVTDTNGNFVKTTVHGFGDTTNECRLIILNNFSFDGYEFSDSYVLLDENGFARNQDMILGTACLRNFAMTIDYYNKDISFNSYIKEQTLKVDYSNIISNDSNIINGIMCLPTDIYLQDSMNEYEEDYER